MIKITVNGKPAPQGSKVRGRYGQIYESNKAVAPWREAVREETQRALPGRAPTTWPVSVHIGFRIARPRAHYGTGRNATRLRPTAPGLPAGKPDLDKLVRAVLDGLKEGGAYRDDSQVVTLTAAKMYAPTPGADITIMGVSDDDG